MRFVVVGAGAVGSFVGGALAQAGHEVTLIGRGRHFRAVIDEGLVVRGTKGSFDVRPAATADVEAIGDTDAVLLAVKAHHLAAVAETLGVLARRETTIVTMQNGVPFWFFEGFGEQLAGTRLATVDPNGAIAAAIEPRAIVACVVNAGMRIPKPGLVEQVANASFALGEIDGSRSVRLTALVDAFLSAGLDAVPDSHIHRTVWDKLIVNVAVNPVSTLARATAEEMVDDPGVTELLREIMREQSDVGSALGLHIGTPVEQRIALIRTYGDQRTSMLQDYQAGRRLELEPIVGAAVEVAGLVDVAVPATRHVYALTKLLDRGTGGRGREAQ